jgi:hypothetical protein
MGMGMDWETGMDEKHHVVKIEMESLYIDRIFHRIRMDLKELQQDLELARGLETIRSSVIKG